MAISPSVKRRWRHGLEDEGSQLSKLGYEDTTKAQMESLLCLFGIDAEGNFFQDKKALEIGCSPFALIHGITASRFKVGIDPCAASDKFKAFYRDNAVCHIAGMAEYLPFKDGSYDVVICINTLDHFLDPEAALKEIFRVLKKEGQILLVTHTLSLYRKVIPVLAHIDQHSYHFTNDDVRSLVKMSGLEIRYANAQRISLTTVLSLFRKKLVKSGLKMLLAIVLQIRDSAFLLTKTTR